MKLKKFQAEVAKWRQANFPNTTSSEQLLGVGEETGELFHAQLKGIQQIRHSSEKIERLKKDAVGDIIVYLASYCDLEGLDLEECIESAWNDAGHRDWQTNKKDGSK